MPLEGSLVSSGAAGKASSAAQSCSTWAAEVAARSFRCLAVSTDSEPFTGMSGPGKVALKTGKVNTRATLDRKLHGVAILH